MTIDISSKPTRPEEGEVEVDNATSISEFVYNKQYDIL